MAIYDEYYLNLHFSTSQSVSWVGADEEGSIYQIYYHT